MLQYSLNSYRMAPKRYQNMLVYQIEKKQYKYTAYSFLQTNIEGIFLTFDFPLH